MMPTQQPEWEEVGRPRRRSDRGGFVNVAILALARAAGASGQTWHDWCCSDEVQALVDSDEIDGCQSACEQAFREGVREHRVSGGWKIAWTTAPEAYDSFGTETIEACGEIYGKPLRKIMMDPRHASYQASRNSSGLHPTWNEDPRVEEAASQARIAKSIADDKARAERRAAGLVWLTTLDAVDLQACLDFDDAHEHMVTQGVSTSDVLHEQKTRARVATESANETEWARCIALVPEGSTILDPGTPGFRGTYGYIQGRPTNVYYNVRIVRAYPDTAEQANVVGEGINDYKGSCNAGSLSDVADMIARGSTDDVVADAEGFPQRVMRIVDPNTVPPRPVLERIGRERLLEIRRVEAAGRVVWVGRPTFGETLVLDERGHLVRAKKVLAALAALWKGVQS